MTTTTPPVCRRTRAWIRAWLAIHLSVRVGEVLRKRVGPEGDVGHLNSGHVQAMFRLDNERTEANRLIEIAQRWPKIGRAKNGEGENGHYRMDNYDGALMQKDGE